MWRVKIRDQTAQSVQSNPDLHCPQKLLVSSSVRTELALSQTSPVFTSLLFKSFENTVGKGEIAHHGQFHLLPVIFTLLENFQSFSPYLTHSHTMTPFDAPGKQVF